MNEEDIKIDTTQEDVAIDVTDEEQEQFVEDTQENTTDVTEIEGEPND
jgi:hypothetical protein